MLLDLLPLVTPGAPANSTFLLCLSGKILATNTINLDLTADGVGASAQSFGYLPDTKIPSPARSLFRSAPRRSTPYISVPS